MSVLGALRRRPRLAIATFVVTVVSITTAVALAAGPAIQTITPTSADDITNLDVLRQQIRNYYGDPLGTGVFAPDSNYAKEAQAVEGSAGPTLFGRGITRVSHDKAVLFDVDDTTLATWNYEVASNWAFNPTTNAEFVTDQKFPAVPGMVQLASAAARAGYSIFFLTGRPAAQEAATLGNLTSDGVGVDAGYPSPTTLNDGEDGLFTKPLVANYPDYLKAACAGDPGGSCTTSHYKTATRAHIESLGYDIVGNFGDQFSDLVGGYADHTYKMPNPNYFLP
jgi:HAD superfamily, subfamily IIIB (Acid phosphatase)